MNSASKPTSDGDVSSGAGGLASEPLVHDLLSDLDGGGDSLPTKNPPGQQLFQETTAPDSEVRSEGSQLADVADGPPDVTGPAGTDPAPDEPLSLPTAASAPSLRELQEQTSGKSWRRNLEFKPARGGGLVLSPVSQNVITILRNDERWQYVLFYDEFAQQVLKIEAPPWHEDDGPAGPPDEHSRWKEEDTTRLGCWMSREYGLHVGTDVLGKAVQLVAKQRPYHPVQRYLKGLAWDGNCRVERWLSDYLGAEDTPYTRAVGMWWLVSAVARVFQPGCKVDHVLILEGPQGKGKSTALRILAGPYFTDSAFDLSSKDAYLAIQGVWIVELAELASLSKTNAGKAKQFFTSPVDRYRPPYGRQVQQVARQCVFAGTVNEADYLKDDTGNRRYWPVRVGDIDLEALALTRDLLWAEAVHLYREGQLWYPSTAEEHALCEPEQSLRQPTDPWMPVVERWLRKFAPAGISTPQVWTDVLGRDVSQMGTKEQMRIGGVLRSLGWEKTQRRVKGKQTYMYERPDGWERSSDVTPGTVGEAWSHTKQHRDEVLEAIASDVSRPYGSA